MVGLRFRVSAISSCAPALWLVFGCTLLRAQTGSIGGTVTDPSGAVVPGATLNLTEVDRQLVRTTASDDGGNYLFSSLPSGRYELKAEKAGFKTFVQSGLRLE